jgi:hypothetical protein
MKPEEILSGENIAAKCDYVFSQASSKDGVPFSYIADRFPVMRGGEIIFCKTDFISLLNQCINNFVPPEVKLHIVTHDSDFPLNYERMEPLVSRPISWWGMNCETDKANPLPIGIANSYSSVNMREFESSTNPTRLLYINNRIQTYPPLRQWVYDYFSSKSWATLRVPYETSGVDPRYKSELIDHKFVLCPRGNGVDTHRIWEALYSGVIPVVVRHRTHEMLEGQLPILFVDDFSEVTEHMLDEVYDEFKKKSWNTNMLTCSWWIQKIKEHNEY